MGKQERVDTQSVGSKHAGYLGSLCSSSVVGCGEDDRGDNSAVVMRCFGVDKLGSSGLATQSTDARGEADREKGATYRMICTTVLSTAVISCCGVVGIGMSCSVMGDAGCLGGELTTEVFSLEMGRGEERASYILHNRGRSAVHDGWVLWGVHGYKWDLGQLPRAGSGRALTAVWLT